MSDFDPESQFREWKGDFSQSEEAKEQAAWAEKVRLAEEKKEWIASRKAEERARAGRKALRVLLIALPLALLLLALGLLGYPGFQALRASEAARVGNLEKAEELYREAASWQVFDDLFHVGQKADALRLTRRLNACSAGLPEEQIPKGAVKLSGTAEGRNGPLTVVIWADGQKLYRISVTEHSENEGIGGEAARQLPARIYAAQRVDVDAVTGATISSQAICRAASQALNSDAAWAAGIYAWRFGAVTPMPSPTPTPGPKPRDVKVFFYENELEEFTEAVDESVLLHAEAYPEPLFEEGVQFRWSVSDPNAIRLSVSQDTRSCTVLCLMHVPGGVDLTVSCNGFEKTIHIYTKR